MTNEPRDCLRRPTDPIAAAAYDRMAEWLRRAGPPRGPLTDEQRAFRREALADPEWRAFLGLDAL